MPNLYSTIEIISFLAIIFIFSAPGGSIAQDGDKVVSTECCVFGNATDLEKVKAWDQVSFYVLLGLFT